MRGKKKKSADAEEREDHTRGQRLSEVHCLPAFRPSAIAALLRELEVQCNPAFAVRDSTRGDPDDDSRPQKISHLDKLYSIGVLVFPSLAEFSLSSRLLAWAGASILPTPTGSASHLATARREEGDKIDQLHARASRGRVFVSCCPCPQESGKNTENIFFTGAPRGERIHTPCRRTILVRGNFTHVVQGPPL